MQALIIPNSIHTEPRLFNIQPSHTSQKLLIPPINFYPSLLIVRQCQPLITPITWTDGIGMTAAGRRRVHADVLLDAANGRESEGADVAGEGEGVGARGGVEVFAAVR